MTPPYEHPQLKATGEIALGLFEAAARAARLAAKEGRRLGRRQTYGRCLPPGPGTPLWNELLARAKPHLVKRGSKARLARMLGLPRQRLQDVLKAKTACLDAERTLALLCWVVARDQGRDFSR
jgi:hypothetical protein